MLIERRRAYMILCVNHVIPYYAHQYPDDRRPQEALAKAWKGRSLETTIELQEVIARSQKIVAHSVAQHDQIKDEGRSAYDVYAYGAAAELVVKAVAWTLSARGPSTYEVLRCLDACRKAARLIGETQVAGEVIYDDNLFRGGIEWKSHLRPASGLKAYYAERHWQNSVAAVLR